MGSFLEVFDPSSAPTTEYGALRPGLFLEGNWKPVSDFYMHGGHYLMRLNDHRSGILMRQRTLGSLCVHRTSFPLIVGWHTNRRPCSIRTRRRLRRTSALTCKRFPGSGLRVGRSRSSVTSSGKTRCCSTLARIELPRVIRYAVPTDM